MTIVKEVSTNKACSKLLKMTIPYSNLLSKTFRSHCKPKTQMPKLIFIQVFAFTLSKPNSIA